MDEKHQLGGTNLEAFRIIFVNLVFFADQRLENSKFGLTFFFKQVYQHLYSCLFETGMNGIQESND